MPIADFYLGPGKVDRQPGELLTEIISPHRPKGERGCYLKYSMREAMDIATLSLAVLVTVEDQKISKMRLACGVMNPVPMRLFEAEKVGEGQFITDDIIEEVSEASVIGTNARDSWRAGRKFREHMLKVYCKKALTDLLKGEAYE